MTKIYKVEFTDYKDDGTIDVKSERFFEKPKQMFEYISNIIEDNKIETGPNDLFRMYKYNIITLKYYYSGTEVTTEIKISEIEVE